MFVFSPHHILHLFNNKCQIATFVLSYDNLIAFTSCFLFCFYHSCAFISSINQYTASFLSQSEIYLFKRLNDLFP